MRKALIRWFLNYLTLNSGDWPRQEHFCNEYKLKSDDNNIDQ